MSRPSDGWGTGALIFAFFIGCSCFGRPNGVADGKRSRNWEVDNLERKVSDLERAKRSLEGEKSDLERAKRSLESEVRDFESEKRDLESKVRQLESEKRVLETESREFEDLPK